MLPTEVVAPLVDEALTSSAASTPEQAGLVNNCSSYKSSFQKLIAQIAQPPKERASVGLPGE